eukprot:SAG31_NODE_3230_length_4516_cov_3.158252_2_plen_115_part_00
MGTLRSPSSLASHPLGPGSLESRFGPAGLLLLLLLLLLAAGPAAALMPEVKVAGVSPHGSGSYFFKKKMLCSVSDYMYEYYLGNTKFSNTAVYIASLRLEYSYRYSILPDPKFR